MPLVQVSVVEGAFTPKEKQAIIERVTDAMVDVTGESLRAATWVTIEEVADWGIAGKTIRASDVAAMRGIPSS